MAEDFRPAKGGSKNKMSRWLRVIHRDLGFLMVGVCLVYGISGFLLNHMDGKDPAFRTQEETLHLDKGLSHEELSVIWNDKGLPELKKIMTIDEEHARLMLNGGVGVYNSETGTVDYGLHYNRLRGWNIMADLFAFSLIFFALSGLFIVKGKKGMAGTGKWYLLAGILIPVLYVLFG